MSNTDLIAEARAVEPIIGSEHLLELFTRLTDALEAVDDRMWIQRVDEAEGEVDELRDRIAELEAQVQAGIESEKSHIAKAREFYARVLELEAERDEVKREMHSRELHHFEEEQISARLAAKVAELEAIVENVDERVALAEDTRDIMQENARLAAKVAELEAENDVKSDHITALVTVTNRLAATIEQAEEALNEWANDDMGRAQHARNILASADTSVLADRDAAKFREGQQSVTIGFTPGEGRPIRIFEDNPYGRREEPKP